MGLEPISLYPNTLSKRRPSPESPALLRARPRSPSHTREGQLCDIVCFLARRSGGHITNTFTPACGYRRSGRAKDDQSRLTGRRFGFRGRTLVIRSPLWARQTTERARDPKAGAGAQRSGRVGEVHVWVIAATEQLHRARAIVDSYEHCLRAGDVCAAVVRAHEPLVFANAKNKISACGVVHTY